MAKELFIVFLYDTEVHLREEEDPQAAVVFFHPSWVNANQRMALCGQLIGVTQFLATGFSFPYTISLNSGKFAMKQLGRFILCVGTDRNITHWILEERCEILINTLQFFHNDLSVFGGCSERRIDCEKLINAMEVYLPVLLYAGNIFGNSLTIRLPKSASSIFLEAAQVLECLQNNEGVYGGAIFYQNKVVMSQLNAHITKQIVVTDPYRIKIPAECSTTSFELPTGVQLLLVYVDETELTNLGDEKFSMVTSRKPIKSKERTVEELNNDFIKWTTLTKPLDRSRIFTVMEEEFDAEQPTGKPDDLSRMPDVVKDTVKTVKEKLEKNKQFSGIRIKSFIVDSFDKNKISSSSSSENLAYCSNDAIRYCSFGHNRDSEEKEKLCEQKVNYTDKSKAARRHATCGLNYYNTISDPVNPWFRENGLPASKALRDDQFTVYCQDINTSINSAKLDKRSKNVESTKIAKSNSILKRPTSIQIATARQDVTNKKSSLHKSVTPFTDLKREFSDSKSQRPPIAADNTDVPLTPLMSKLSMSDLSQTTVPPVLTPAASLRCLHDEITASKEEMQQKLKHQAKLKPRRRKSISSSGKRNKRTILFVFGYQNISLYLLLNEDSNKNPEFIKKLWKICISSVKDLELHFQQCLESAPQTHAMNTFNESYSYLNIHSVWETLHYGGTWTGRQLDLLNTMHNDFNCDTTLTDVTFRLDDSIVYGSQIADNQLFYQQSVSSIAGLPMPSDSMGIVSLKAKRRLERDHGLLIV